MNTLDPADIMVAIPAHDGRIMSELAGMLVVCAPRFSMLSIKTECSHVSLVRNVIAETFLATPYKWLICIDSDITFQIADLDYLLEPAVNSTDDQQSRPTRVEETIITGRSSKGYIREKSICDQLVVAEYPYKNDTLEPVKLGMGFVRIHRSVFERIAELKHDDTGEPRVWQTSYQGKLITDYYPSGPLINHLVPCGEWRGEDHGFFTLCMLSGIIPRSEKRSRLGHIGRKVYVYDPDAGAAQ